MSDQFYNDNVWFYGKVIIAMGNADAPASINNIKAPVTPELQYGEIIVRTPDQIDFRADVTVNELAENPELLVGKTVRVEGFARMNCIIATELKIYERTTP